ncbi:MAG: cytidine deaminase [bacterium]
MTKQPLPIISKEVRAFLISAAREAAAHAHCPYSHYPVGAAVLTADGQIYTGCNVENISYGLSTCAERTALVKAVSAGCRDFVALAIAGGEQKGAAPCGACRQVLAEFCAPGLPVFIARRQRGTEKTTSLGALLPMSFASLK